MKPKATTRICHSTADDVFVRGRSLTEELIGRVSFTEMIYLQILGRMPTPGQTAMLDACLVTLVEHGLTPTAITTRMTYTSAPESIQGAVAAGLASVGSLFVGTVEGCALLLARMVQSEDGEAEAVAIVREHRDRGARVPGFGHPIHRPDDPRTPRLLAVAREHGVAGAHVDALETLSAVVDRERGKHLTINATGAIAATLADCDVPAEILRGIALISRCAGLVGHVREEQLHPAMNALWEAAEAAVPFEHTPEEDS
ncbi:MAG: citryl-CoA lyase [Sandaracinaceae bacterium]|nr:citryl-CoA lyase [Sandaracinaceae bacterium]